MGTIAQNLEAWNSKFDWSRRGDEWSDFWGSPDAQWFGAILPRVHAFVPAGTILEIAPGFGRWTQYLKGLCDRLILVDLAPRCIDHCRERFAGETKIEYHVNDGRSLAMVPAGSADFVFSFDSLVHAEAVVIDSYLEQLSQKLRPDGVGFIHHSNAGTYRPLTELTHRTPDRFRRRLIRAGLLPDIHAWRDNSMTAATFVDQCATHGLSCIAQERINWGGSPFLSDAISTFTRIGSRWDRTPRLQRNRHFNSDARRLATLYARPSR